MTFKLNTDRVKLNQYAKYLDQILFWHTYTHTNWSAKVVHNNNNKSSESHFKRARCHPSWQRMHSPTSCATICTMPSADESNHSAAGTLHPHCSATCVL